MSRAYEEAREDAANARIASELGLTADEFDQVVQDVLEDVSDDGVVYGLIVNFSTAADPVILAKVKGLDAGRYTINLGPIYFDEAEED